MLPTDSDTKKIQDENNGVKKKLEETKQEIREQEHSEQIVSENKTEEPIIDIAPKKEDDQNQTKEESPFLKTTYQTNTESLEQKFEKTEDLDENDLSKMKKIFESKCVLYRYVEGKTELEQRGTGRIYIILVEEANLYKIMMVRDKIKRLGCNHYISPLFSLSPHEKTKNVWIWSTLTDTCEEDSKLDPKQTYVARFKNSEICEEFKSRYEEAQNHNEEILTKKEE